MKTPEKYFRVYTPHSLNDIGRETIDGTGYDDTLKASNLSNLWVANKTFIGSPSENDIDLVRGGPYYVGPNVHVSKPGVSNITAKGGLKGLHLSGNFGTLEWGQFSIYDKWGKLPKSTGLAFEPAAVGKVTVWNGEVPAYVPPGVKIKKIPSLVVKAYFIFRSVQLSITGK